MVDHIGKPDIGAGIYEPWRELIGQLAALPNVWCKLSGLVTEAGEQWQAASITQYVRDVVELVWHRAADVWIGLAGVP